MGYKEMYEEWLAVTIPATAIPGFCFCFTRCIIPKTIARIAVIILIPVQNNTSEISPNTMDATAKPFPGSSFRLSAGR